MLELRPGGVYEVHDVSCPDIRRKKSQIMDATTLDAESAEEFVADFFADVPDWIPHTKILPCANTHTVKSAGWQQKLGVQESEPKWRNETFIFRNPSGEEITLHVVNDVVETIGNALALEAYIDPSGIMGLKREQFLPALKDLGFEPLIERYTVREEY